MPFHSSMQSSPFLFLLLSSGTDGHISLNRTLDHGVPQNVAVPHLNSSAPGSAARSPLAIHFGAHEISTWYSSPYPQVRRDFDGVC